MEALWSHDDYGLFLCSEAVGRFSPNQTAPMFSLSLGWKTSVRSPKILSCENGAFLQNSFKNLPVLQSCCDFPWPLESHLLKCDPLQSWVGSLATTSTTVEDRGAPEAKRYCSLKTYCLKYFLLKSHSSPFLTHPLPQWQLDQMQWTGSRSRASSLAEASNRPYWTDGFNPSHFHLRSPESCDWMMTNLTLTGACCTSARCWGAMCCSCPSPSVSTQGTSYLLTTGRNSYSYNFKKGKPGKGDLEPGQPWQGDSEGPHGACHGRGDQSELPPSISVWLTVKSICPGLE